MNWSENVKNPPMLLAPEGINLRDRAYPYADTSQPPRPSIEDLERILNTEKEPGVVVLPNGEVRTVSDCDGPNIIVTPQSVTFIGQRGPIKEVGINGCQIDDLITFTLGTIQTFNKKFPCRENSIAITKLEEALHWLDARKRNREDRGVEGHDKE